MKEKKTLPGLQKQLKKKRNVFALALRNPLYQQKIVRNKKDYSRKGKDRFVFSKETTD